MELQRVGYTHYIIDTTKVKFQVEKIEDEKDKNQETQERGGKDDPSLYVLPAIHDWGTVTLESLSLLLEEIVTFTPKHNNDDDDDDKDEEDHYKQLLVSLKKDAEEFYSCNYGGFYSTSHSRCQMLLRWMQKYQDISNIDQRKGIEGLLGICVDVLSNSSDISKLFFPTARINIVIINYILNINFITD